MNVNISKETKSTIIISNNVISNNYNVQYSLQMTNFLDQLNCLLTKNVIVISVPNPPLYYAPPTLFSLLPLLSKLHMDILGGVHT